MSDADAAGDARAADVDLAGALSALEDGSPLVTSLTNVVTVNDVANVILYWGGLPVMTRDRREVADMLAIAGACLLNMGTADETQEETIVEAGRAANEQGLPVVFDPVGAGATPTRTRIAERVVDEVDVTVVNGNYGEVTALVGEDAEVRGVESVGEYAEIAETAMACAQATGAVVVASGAVDIVATDSAAYEVDSGDPMMGEFVGTGCMQAATLAAFAGGLPDGLAAALSGTLAFGLAGERAADAAFEGPASYRTAFLDSVAAMDAGGVADDIASGRIERVAGL